MKTDEGNRVKKSTENWTIESIFEDWIDEKKLTQRKLSWLEANFRDAFIAMERDFAENYPKTIAPNWMRSELDNPNCLFVIQCVAELLDILKPRKTDIPRMMKVSDFLKMKRLLVQ